MSYEVKFPDWEDRVRAAAASSLTATGAAAILGVKYQTYKKYAEKYGCFVKNPAGKGMPGEASSNKIPIEEILEGLHPQYQSNKLRKRLLSENIFPHICFNCELEVWLNQPIPLELNHIDGDCHNHILSNLELLCPNCHSLTDTYRGKNKGVVVKR